MQQQVIVQGNDQAEPHKKSFVQSFLRQLKNGTPIYRVQLPIFLIEPRSLLERYSDFGVHLDMVLNLYQVADPEVRFLQVLKFYLSGWHVHPKEVKNPFNPILGEVFRCSYADADSTTEYIAEQISHHPPSTAFCLYNAAKSFALNGYVKPTSHFSLKSNSMETSLEGELRGHLFTLGEEYHSCFPKITVKGIMFGTLTMDLCGNAFLRCPQTGYSANMEFKSKGLFSGKESHVSVKVVRGTQLLYTLEGRWDGVINITSIMTNQTCEFFNAGSGLGLPKVVQPIERQQENESRRVWGRVMSNINSHQEWEAQREKTIVEDAQRAREATMRASGQTFKPSHFTRVSDDYYICNKLLQASQPQPAAKPVNVQAQPTAAVYSLGAVP